MWLLCLLVLALNSVLLGQEAATFRSDVSLVRVETDVRVGDAPVAGLRKEDFRILDGGKIQTVAAIGHEEVPLEMVLLLDTRPNMLRIVERLAAATQSALGELRESDRVAIVALGAGCKTALVSDFTNDTEALERALQNYLSKGDLLSVTKHAFCQPMQALRASAQVFQGQHESNRRRSIVGISDDRGAGTASDLVRQGVHDLWISGAVVLRLGLKSDIKEFHIGTLRGMRFAADQTGGEAVDFDDVPEGLRDAIRRLRSRYSLFYAPPAGKPGEERKIRVELTPNAAKGHKNAVVRSRSGYVVPSVEGLGAR